MTDGGWPQDWDERKQGKDCPICVDGRPEEFEFGIRILSTEETDAYLQKQGWTRGYSVVIWRGRHVAEPMELAEDEAAAYWRDLLRVGRAIDTYFRPMKINLEIHGNTIPHLHTHVLPRYRDDPAPGGPIAWQALRTSDPIPDTTLQRQATDLRALLTR